MPRQHRLRRRSGGGRVGVPWSHRPSPNSHGGGEIPRAVGVCLCQRPAERRGGAARPEQESDDEAHGAADRDVLDPDQSDSPADRLEDVEQDHERQRERGLAGSERDRRRCEPGKEDRQREENPEHGGVRADQDEERRTDDEPGCGAEQCPDDALARVERIRAQH